MKMLGGLLSFVLLVACHVSMSSGPKGSGVAKTESRTVAAFHAVSVAEGIELDVATGPVTPIQVTADDDVLADVVTDVAGGKLDVHMKPGSKHSVTSVKVVATTASLDTLAASSGATLNAKGVAGDVNLSASSGASINADGTAKTETASASSGSSIHAKGVKADDAHVSANSGASIATTVSGSIDGAVSSGASIEVHGSPKARSVKESSGGSVDYR